MTARDSSPRAKRDMSISVVLGTVLVPLSAFAASALVDTSGVGESARGAMTPPVAETNVASLGADTETACGEEGLAMVAAETAGAITDVQQAALDALRGICAEQGMPLPARQALQPEVTTVTQPSAPASEQVLVASDDDDHHGRHGGDDHDEDDHDRHVGDDDHGGRHGDDDDDRDGEDHD